MSNWLRVGRVYCKFNWYDMDIHRDYFFKNYIPQGDLDTLVFLNVEAIKLKFWIDS